MKWAAVIVLYAVYCVTIYVFTWRWETIGVAEWRLAWIAVPAMGFVTVIVFKAVNKRMRRKT